MRIMGIDPGTKAMGYGVLESNEGKTSLVDYGVLTPAASASIGERLSYLYNGLLEIISRTQPDAIAIEQPFVAKNARTALVIGMAQAVAILAAANRGITACEYTPARIKQSVANYGVSSKEQIQEMVKLWLGLSKRPEPSDAADALAVALCHLSETQLNHILASQDKR